MSDSKMKKYKRRFGVRLEQLREQRGLTKTALADLIGKERQDIWALEVGDRNPTLETLILLAQALEVSLPELLDFDIEK